MRIFKTVSRFIFGLFFIGAGIMHFVRTDFYMKIMPPYLPLHLELVYLRGFFEVALGMLLLVPRFSRLAAWGIIALLIAVFPANIYMALADVKIHGFPSQPWMGWARLPLPARPPPGIGSARQAARWPRIQARGAIAMPGA